MKQTDRLKSDREIIADLKQQRQQRQQKQKQAGPGARQPMLPPPTAPMQVARKFVEQCCLCDGDLTLRYWHGGWWAWQVSHWMERENRAVRSLLYAFTEHALYFDGKDVKPWEPNRYKIGDLLEALSAIVILSDEIEQPCWIDGRENGTIVAVGNGLLDVGSRQLLPHSPQYFNQTSVPFAYDGAPGTEEVVRLP